MQMVKLQKCGVGEVNWFIYRIKNRTTDGNERVRKKKLSPQCLPPNSAGIEVESKVDNKLVTASN